MAWEIEFSPSAERELNKVDPQTANRIMDFLELRVARLGDPRSIGEPLKGPTLREFWRYRIGDYRVFVSIKDRAMQVLVVKIGNRRDVYR